MDKDLLLQEAARWFDKLNDPSAATYRIAHARHDNSAKQFDPSAVLEQYLKTSAQRMERLDAATKVFPGQPSGEGKSD